MPVLDRRLREQRRATSSWWLRKVISSLPVSLDQVFTVLSALAVASRRPSALKATSVSGPSCPRKLKSFSPVVPRKTSTVASVLGIASRWPSGENEGFTLLCPLRVNSTLPSPHCRTVTVPSWLAVARIKLSGLKTRFVTARSPAGHTNSTFPVCPSHRLMVLPLPATGHVMAVWAQANWKGAITVGTKAEMR